MTIETAEVTTPVVDTPVNKEDGYEVETNIVLEDKAPESEEPKQSEVEPSAEPLEEPKKPLNPRTLARKAEKERLIRENATMAERLKQYEAKQAQPEAKQARDTSQEPNIQDYDDVLEYNRDIAKYEAVQAFKQETSRLNTEKRIESFREKAETVRAEKPDFDERVAMLNTSGLITPELDEAIMSSNMSPEVAYHLSQYSDDLMTLRGLPKDMLPKAMKAIEAFIKQGGEQKEQPRVTKAQPPITPPGMTTKTDRSLTSYTQEEIENMPLSEFNKRFK